jgi:TolB-like protein
MRKMILVTGFIFLTAFAFGGGQWAADDRVAYDGESEIVFTYNGPNVVNARVYEDNVYIGSLSPGSSKRKIVTDGSHTFEVRPAVYDSVKKETIENTAGAKKLTITSLKNRGSVSITISSLSRGNTVTDFSLIRTAAITTQPKPQDTDAASAPATPAARPAAPADRPADDNTIEAAVKRAADVLALDLPDGATLAIINISSRDADMAEFIIEELAYLMVHTRKFKVVDRKSLDAIKTEQNFQYSGEVDDDSAVSIGKLLGASFVITGSISGSGSTRRLRAKALNVLTAEIVTMASEWF